MAGVAPGARLNCGGAAKAASTRVNIDTKKNQGGARIVVGAVGRAGVKQKGWSLHCKCDDGSRWVMAVRGAAALEA